MMSAIIIKAKCKNSIPVLHLYYNVEILISPTFLPPSLPLSPEDPQLWLGNSDRTHVRHAFVPLRTFPGGVSGIHEVMLFTLLPCDAALTPSYPPIESYVIEPATVLFGLKC